MLHQPLDGERLLASIKEISPSWLQRAREETALNHVAGQFVSKKGIWSEIKSIFVSHQRRKCAYCERQLGASGIEWDVEHFRPKRKVIAWTSEADPGAATGGADPTGYFTLAFEPRNYLVACKPCNSIHKRNFFPVAGRRQMHATSVEGARAERPYLINPLDPVEQAPEDLIGFRGINPRLLGTDPTARRRAQFTIEVVGLDRPDLDLERARTIVNVWNALRLAENGLQAGPAIAAMTDIASPHANCARCFRTLFEDDRVAAEEIGELALNFVSQHSL